MFGPENRRLRGNRTAILKYLKSSHVKDEARMSVAAGQVLKQRIQIMSNEISSEHQEEPPDSKSSEGVAYLGIWWVLFHWKYIV